MTEALKAIVEQRVIGIIRSGDAHEAERCGELLIEAGLHAIEVSLVTPGAVEVIRRLASGAPRSVHIGVGTALTPDDAAAAADVGASFVVSPTLDAATIAKTKALGLCSCPGVATPTEALVAVRAGADLCKVFPASAWTPGALADWLTAMPGVRSVPTGGVTMCAAPDWIAAGAVAVGLGGALIKGPSNQQAARILDLVTRLQEAR